MHSVAIGTYFPVGIEMVGRKMVGIEKVFVTNRSQCLPSIHLLFLVSIELVFPGGIGYQVADTGPTILHFRLL